MSLLESITRLDSLYLCMSLLKKIATCPQQEEKIRRRMKNGLLADGKLVTWAGCFTFSGAGGATL